MQSRIDDIRAAGGEVIAISVDPPEETREAFADYGFSFPILSDPDLLAIDAFGVRHTRGGYKGNDIARPATFLLDREGRIVWRDLTDNWRVRVRPERVLAQLTAIP